MNDVFDVDEDCYKQGCLEPGAKIEEVKVGIVDGRRDWARTTFINVCERHSLYPIDYLLPGVFWLHDIG